MKTIRINDAAGKRWIFEKEDIEEFYFDNSKPNDWVLITVNGVQIKVNKSDLAGAFPHVAEEMDIKL